MESIYYVFALPIQSPTRKNVDKISVVQSFRIILPETEPNFYSVQF